LPGDVDVTKITPGGDELRRRNRLR